MGGVVLGMIAFGAVNLLRKISLTGIIVAAVRMVGLVTIFLTTTICCIQQREVCPI
jgi:hypothetical protein